MPIFQHLEDESSKVTYHIRQMADRKERAIDPETEVSPACVALATYWTVLEVHIWPIMLLVDTRWEKYHINAY